MKTKISALIIITTLFLGCKKTIFGVGNESKKTIELNEYSEIVLNSSFDIELIPDIKDYAEITAGEKIINDIKLKIKSNRLTINDYSSYNWIKGLNIPKIKLHYTNIDSILITEACKIRNSDIIKSDTRFKIRSTTPFTDIKLNIDVNRLNIITAEKQEGYIILSGKATHCLIANYGTVTLDTRNLYSESMDIYHNNISSCYVRAKSWARVIICRKGDVYMHGYPPTIERIQHGTGKLHLISDK
jgi:hypothetical protein